MDPLVPLRGAVRGSKRAEKHRVCPNEDPKEYGFTRRDDIPARAPGAAMTVRDAKALEKAEAVAEALPEDFSP